MTTIGAVGSSRSTSDQLVRYQEKLAADLAAGARQSTQQQVMRQQTGQLQAAAHDRAVAATTRAPGTTVDITI